MNPAENKKSVRELLEACPQKIIYPNNPSAEIYFDVSELHDSTFKRMIQYYDSITSSPVEYLLTGTLAALSGAIGKYAYYNISEFITVYLNIWAVIIGPSTILYKTTAINTTIYELERISKTELNEYNKKYAEYSKELQGKSKEEKKDVTAPIRKYIILPDDTTLEALTDILSNNGRGIFHHNEFGSFLQQLSRSYSGDSKQFFTNIYDVPNFYEVSRATKTNTILQRPYASIIGASTIDWVKENSAPSDLRTGFLARFLFSIRNTPDSSKPHIPLLKLKNLTKRSDKYFNIREIYDYLTGMDSSIELTLDDNAVDLHCSYDEDNYLDMIKHPAENEISFKGRLIVYCLKIAGLIALADKRTIVKLQDMQDAIHICEYYKRNIEKLLNNEINQTEFSRSENKIISLIESKGGKIQHSELLRLVNLKSKELQELISNLEQKEKIETITGKNDQNKSVKHYQVKKKKS